LVNSTKKVYKKPLSQFKDNANTKVVCPIKLGEVVAKRREEGRYVIWTIALGHKFFFDEVSRVGNDLLDRIQVGSDGLSDRTALAGRRAGGGGGGGGLRSVERTSISVYAVFWANKHKKRNKQSHKRKLATD